VKRPFDELSAPVESRTQTMVAIVTIVAGPPMKVNARKISVPTVFRSPESHRAKLTSQRASGSLVR
jgi:hypothetical protein